MVLVEPDAEDAAAEEGGFDDGGCDPTSAWEETGAAAAWELLPFSDDHSLLPVKPRAERIIPAITVTTI